MKMLFKAKYFLIPVLLVFIIISCDSWLDVTSSSQVRAEDQFESEAGFKDALIGVYLGMTKTDSYGKELSWYLVDLLSQQYAEMQNLSSYSDLQDFQYEEDLSEPRVDAIWSSSYNNIADVNHVLDYFEKNGDVLDPLDHDIIKGELLGLRAFLHFDLLRLFGKGNLNDRPEVMREITIPYVTEFSKNIPPQLSYEEAFAQLNQDIEEGLELLKSDPFYNADERPEDYEELVEGDEFYEDRKLRLNYYALKALQARVLLWQGGTENINNARLAAEEVINNAPVGLVDGESYGVSSDPILYPEVLFSLNVSGLGDIVQPYVVPEGGQATTYEAVYLTDGMVDDIYETSNPNIGPPDVRFNTLLEGQSLGDISIKLLQDGVSHPNTLPLMKLPEMYYIAAEYYIQNNELETAIDYLNQVRTSRGIVEQIPNNADRETVEDELLKEYRKEYVSEGQLFYFYKRIGLTDIPGLSSNIVADDDIYVLPYPDSENIFR